MLWRVLSFAGALCLMYYCLMAAVLKKWDSTFSRFWIFAGVFFLGLGRLHIKAVIPFLAVFGLFFLAVQLRIFFGMIPCKEEGIPYLIVLGAQVRGTNPSGSLLRRVRRAGQYLLDNPGTKVIVSGGQGKGEAVTEAFAMEQLLAGQGISRERIFREDSSTTTEENLKFSAQYIGNLDGPVGIVTNNFHMYRACCYAKKLGYGKPEALPAGCHPLLFVNYMVREFFALCKFWAANAVKGCAKHQAM